MLKGFVLAATQPVVVEVGAGAEHGKARTCQAVSVPVLVQPKVVDVAVIFEVVNITGCGHVGGGEHEMFEIQPAAVTLAFEVNTKVKQPFVAVEVNDGGSVVPVKFAKSVPVASLPLYIFKKSKLACKLNAVNVIVTASPALTGHIVVVVFELLT
jgi:hypothetical protein